MADPEREESLRVLVARDRGDPAFAELADLQMARGEHQQALVTLLGGLSANPSHQVGRLILARLFLHLDFTPFAIRELRELRASAPSCESLKRLIEAVAPGSLAAEQGSLGIASHVSEGAAGASSSSVSRAEEVVAEDEFEFDILES